jgi:TonB family protein
MKFVKLFSTIILLNTILINFGFSQENEIVKLSASENAFMQKIDSNNTKLIFINERMPRFPGCEDFEGTDGQKAKCAEQKMLTYIYSNLKYPEDAQKYHVQGQVVLKFLIDSTGFISNVEILRDPGRGLGEAAKEVVLSMNDMPEKWIHGIQRGKAVNVMYTIPVKFSLNDESKKRNKKKRQ